MGNQTWVYCIESERLIAHQVEQKVASGLPVLRVFKNWFYQIMKREQKPAPALPLLQWVQQELIRARVAKDEDKQSIIQEDVLGYLLKAPGMYGLTTFQKASALYMEVATIRPHVPERFHPRLDHLVEQGTAQFPDHSDTPLQALSLPGWTFFTREEIIEIGPSVRAALAGRHSDSLEYEWNDILTAQ